jgi:hypothetical protein
MFGRNPLPFIHPYLLTSGPSAGLTSGKSE